MKSMFFFPGQWRGIPGEAFYAGPNPGAPPLAPATNAFCLYTVLPVDGWMNLGWSDNVGGEKRGHAVDLMLAAGVNVEVFRGLATGLCRDPGSNCDARDGSPQLTELIAWKRDYISAWVNTGIPVILDVSSGYDAHRVFGADNPPRYGNNEPWRVGQEQMLDSPGVRGITGNAWNGYTEALAFVPSCTAGPPGLPFCGTDAVFTEGRKAFDWFRRLTPVGGIEARLPARLVLTSPATAVYSDPVKLDIQLTSLDLDQALFSHPPARTAVGSRVVRLRVGQEQMQITTDASGMATAMLTIDQRPGDVPVQVAAHGDGEYLPIEAPRSSLRVVRESTSVHLEIRYREVRGRDRHRRHCAMQGQYACHRRRGRVDDLRRRRLLRARDGIAHQRHELERHCACHSADAQRRALNLRRESRQNLLHHCAHELAISRTRRDVAR